MVITPGIIGFTDEEEARVEAIRCLKQAITTLENREEKFSSLTVAVVGGVEPTRFRKVTIVTEGADWLRLSGLFDSMQEDVRCAIRRQEAAEHQQDLEERRFLAAVPLDTERPN